MAQGIRANPNIHCTNRPLLLRRDYNRATHPYPVAPPVREAAGSLIFSRSAPKNFAKTKITDVMTKALITDSFGQRGFTKALEHPVWDTIRHDFHS